MRDPYFYDDVEVLKNLLNIKNEKPPQHSRPYRKRIIEKFA